MHRLQTTRLREERGFTLIELLVVILIIGILAAIAIPAFLSQKSKAYDSAAKTVAQTAQTAAETYATENSGSYASMSVASLEAIEPSLKAKTTEAHLAFVGLTKPTSKAAVGSPSATEYTVTAEAANTGDLYSVTRKTNGEVEHNCYSATNGCPGHSTTSTSW